jgi:hypothetical protein
MQLVEYHQDIKSTYSISRAGTTPASYSVGPVFKTRAGERLH